MSARIREVAGGLRFPMEAYAINGCKVRIRGNILPPLEVTGLTGFWFTPETHHKAVTYRALEHGPVHSTMPVSLLEGQTESYTQRPIMIEGILKIDIEIYEDGVEWIYKITEGRIVEKNTKLRGHPAVVMWGC